MSAGKPQRSAEALAERLTDRFGDALAACRSEVGEVTIEVARQHLAEVATALRDETEFSFRQLVDLCGIDYAEYGKAEWATTEASSTGFSRGVETGQAHWTRPRFAVVYHLLSHRHNRRLRMRVFTEGDPPLVDTVVAIWPVADWFEREAFDLYGILFDGHPDLRRILTDYGFIGHPFRKDFPLIGHVEMRYDVEQGRVVYEPVTIEPRVLVPRVIRHDSRYTEADADMPQVGGSDETGEG